MSGEIFFWNSYIIFSWNIFLFLWINLFCSIAKCFMLKFAETLILMRRKIFSAFYLVLHEPFSNSYGFPLMQEFNPFCSHLVLCDRKHFCSFLTDLSSLSFLFHQKFPLVSYDVKNVLTKQFPKMQKQPFANVLRKQSPRDIL